MGRGGCDGDAGKPRVVLSESPAAAPSPVTGLSKRSVPAGANGTNGLKQYSMKDVREHNRKGDAWIVVKNKVYDVSTFGDRHPGGSVIFSMAGRDATDVFASFHAPSTASFLPHLCIGVLKEAEQQVPSGLLQDFRDLRASLQQQGLFESNKAYYAFKLSSTLAILSLSLAMLAISHHLAWVVTSGLLLGLFWQQAGWLAHDFLHHQVFSSRRLNTWVGGYVMGNLAQGFSPTWWKNKHNTHHAVPNECDAHYNAMDPDIDTLPLLAWSEEMLDTVKDKNLRALLRRQSLLFLPMLLFARFAWSYASLAVVCSSVVPAKERVPERLFHALHYAWVLGVAFGALPLPLGLAWLLAAQMAGGACLGIVFVQSHNAMEVYNDDKDFCTAQIVTTRDVTGGLFNDWFTGGLNRQLEHHLFPTMPRHHLGKVASRVRQLCEKHGLEYQNVDFSTGTSLIIRHLARVAQAA